MEIFNAEYNKTKGTCTQSLQSNAIYDGYDISIRFPAKKKI